MFESSEVVSGGTSASAVAAPNASAASAPVEEGGGGRRRISRTRRINSQLSSLLPKEGGTYGGDNMNGLTRREIS